MLGEYQHCQHKKTLSPLCQQKWAETLCLLLTLASTSVCVHCQGQFPTLHSSIICGEFYIYLLTISFTTSMCVCMLKGLWLVPVPVPYESGLCILQSPAGDVQRLPGIFECSHPSGCRFIACLLALAYIYAYPIQMLHVYQF